MLMHNNPSQYGDSPEPMIRYTRLDDVWIVQ